MPPVAAAEMEVRMKKELFMSIDIGTSGIRAALYDLEGNQVSLYHQEYPMISTSPGMSELKPDEVFLSLIEVVRQCKERNQLKDSSIEGIGLSSQMHSFLAVDSEGNCLTNVLTWADSRPIGEANFIKNNFDHAELYNRTGCRVQHPMYPLSKILWLKNNRFDCFKNAYKFITIKSYIAYRLFGRYVIDITDASATGCFNIHTFKWDAEILHNILGVDKGRFPQPVDCTYVMKNMKDEYARAMGIDPGIPVVIGSGDGIMANVGCGVFDDTSMSCTIGTSGALRIAVDKPLLDTHQRTWCYCFTKDTWVAGGAVNNGGIVLRWLRDEYRNQYEYELNQSGSNSRNIYELFDQYASEVNPGSDGLIFLPYLTGERSPGWNAKARGTIYGIQLMHNKKHFIRAAMEGVIYNMYSIYEIITQLNDRVQVIMANGGYVNSDIWLQIQADIFNREIAVAGIGEAAAFGAAYTAMAALGAVPSLSHPLKRMKPSGVVKPSKANHSTYAKMYEQFKELYSKLYM
jgi:gluconokinase